MTDVPEHLLRRSAERKAALGQGPPPSEDEAGSAAVAPVAGAAPAATSAAAAPAVAAPPPEPEVVVPRLRPPRARVPMWAMPVLAILPFWAIAYGGAFGERSTGVETPIQAGGALFATNCATCHGASGQGGVGPALAAVEKTFPDLKDHVSWVETGSKPFAGQTYGQGTRVATGGMPAFKDTLSATQIADIVCYERVTFGGGTEAKDCPAATAAPAG